MQIVPNSFGTTLREFNHCHGADDGRFCATPGGARARTAPGKRTDSPLGAEPRRGRVAPPGSRTLGRPSTHKVARHNEPEDYPAARAAAAEEEKHASPELKRHIDRVRAEAEAGLKDADPERRASAAMERDYAPLIAKGELAFEASFKEDTSSKHRGADGGWTPERAKLHEEILTRVVAEKFGNVQTGLANPTVVFLGGMPGAGKSSASRGLDTANAFTIDPDEFKKELPEFNGANAAAVAAESGYLADRLMKIAHAARANVLIDGTMKTGGTPGADLDDGLLGKLAAFKESGYRTEVRFVDVTTEQSIQRVTGRYLREINSGRKNARNVPLGFVRKGLSDPKYGTKPKRSFELVKNTQLEKGGWLVDSYVAVNGWTRERLEGRGTLKDTL